MSPTIDSTRFGRIEVAPDERDRVPRTASSASTARRFTLVARDEDDAFVWLHSLEDPALALPVTDPRRFFAGFELELADGERERLGARPRRRAEADVYVTVRASERLEDFTANLRAPIVIVGRPRLPGDQPGAGAPSCARRCSPSWRRRRSAPPDPVSPSSGRPPGSKEDAMLIITRRPGERDRARRGHRRHGRWRSAARPPASGSPRRRSCRSTARRSGRRSRPRTRPPRRSTPRRSRRFPPHSRSRRVVWDSVPRIKDTPEPCSRTVG